MNTTGGLTALPRPPAVILSADAPIFFLYYPLISSIVYEVIGVILFFYEETLLAKKTLKNQANIRSQKAQIKNYLFTFYAPYAF